MTDRIVPLGGVALIGSLYAEPRTTLYFLRARRGWSQSELARRAGIAPSLENKYEAGVQEPTLRTARRLARALGITLDELATAFP